MILSTQVQAKVETLFQRPVANLWQSILILGRERRTRLPSVRAGAYVAVAIAVAAIVASMFLLDAPASEWARHLPLWVTMLADEITNFGLGGRFLYPLAFVLLILAVSMRPSLSRMS